METWFPAIALCYLLYILVFEASFYVAPAGLKLTM